MENKEAFDTDGKEGVFYLVPNLKSGRYYIYTQTEGDTPEPLHIDLWEEVKMSLTMKFGIQEVDAFNQYYRGLPRGRVMKSGTRWIVGWGNDFPLELYKSDIIKEFNLQYAQSAGNVVFEVQDHETMEESAKKYIEKTLGIKITHSGFSVEKKTVKKKKTHEHSDNCNICKISNI